MSYLPIFVRPAKRPKALASERTRRLPGFGEVLLVTLPGEKQPIPPEGAMVPRTTFVLRRLNDGDLIEVADKSKKGAEPKATKS